MSHFYLEIKDVYVHLGTEYEIPYKFLHQLTNNPVFEATYFRTNSHTADSYTYTHS